MNSNLKTSLLGLLAGLSSVAVFASGTATDTASNYSASGAWGNSPIPANLGSGFGNWNFTFINASNPPYAGTYLDLASYGNPDGALYPAGPGGFAWGTYANGSNPSGTGAFEAMRPFTTGASGSSSLYNQTFSMLFASQGVGTSQGQSMGVNIGSAFSLLYSGGGPDSLMVSVDGGAPISTGVTQANLTSGLKISLSVSGPLNSPAEVFSLVLGPAAGGPAYATLNGTFNSAVYDTSSFTVIDNNTAQNGYFNNPNITPELVPEPSSLALLGMSAFGMLALYRRGRKE
jgi:hypothetical protein